MASFAALDAELPTVVVRRLEQSAGPRGVSIADHLRGWQGWLTTFVSEIDLGPAEWSDRTQHRFDWQGLMHMRDLIGQLEGLPPEVVTWLETGDAFLRANTEEVVDWDLDPHPSASWWWQRLPVRGPVRAGWWAK